MIENITNFSGADLTPLIAVIAIYIAYQQWQTNRLRLKHELFDRRFEIYKRVQIHLSLILQTGNVKVDEIHLLVDAQQKSRFLIGNYMQKYIDGIYEHSIKAMMYESQLEGVPVGNERNDLVEKESLEVKWIIGQI